MKKLSIAALLSGALFGLGLAMSGMTDPRRVLGFLDVFGDFDPTLAFVLGGAVATTTLLFRFVLRRGNPVLADTFHLSNIRQVDSRLLGGAAIFGVGWGIAGYCPGPSLAGLGVLSLEALWFVPSMVAGILVHRAVNRA
ncbi:MAG: YeeE/YedE family protein [Rhodanobacteraceae bacterium]|nr:YeeE/YedE family protein [Rhodanobacteraceae bacterium]